MGGMTPQFRYLLNKHYEAKKEHMNVRERVSVCYAITKNDGEPDLSLIELLPAANMNELVTMMRCFEMKDLITKDMLDKFSHHYILRKKEINLVDLSESIRIFFRHAYYPPGLE